jgi:hypothetical protein
MDYVYYGPQEWPLASTILSVVGLAMMFGRQIALGIETALGLVFDELRPILIQALRPWVACVALLVLPIVQPNSALVQSLRGTARLDDVIETARADGYYEDLIRSSGDRRKPRAAEPPPGRVSFANSGLMTEVADYRRRVLRPGLDAQWNGTSFRTGSQGFRGPAISPGKSADMFRVVVLGSSNTMGHGVDDEQSYVRLLEAWLAGRSGPGRRVEVVNLAISGDSPTQKLYRLRELVPPLEPDWIFCDVTALDFSLEEQHLRWVVDNRVEVPFDFVQGALRRSGVAAGDTADQFHKKFRAEVRPLLDRTFQGWAAEARRAGVPLSVLILPRADSKAESSAVFQHFRDLASRHNLPALDLSETFDRFELDEYRIGPWDDHPNAFGHRLIFARLRARLADNPKFPRNL